MRSETAQETAGCEAVEVTGIDLDARQVMGERVDDNGGWSYTTVLTSTAVPLPVQGDRESLELRWGPLDQVDELPLLRAFRATWPVLLECLR